MSELQQRLTALSVRGRRRAIGDSGDASAELAAADLRSDVTGDPFVVTVQRDGNWYVSPAYTALEYVRVLNDLPAADLGSVRTAQLGADTPEAAVRDAITALGTRDLERVFAVLPPDELPLYDYRAALTQLAAESDWGFTVERFSATTEVDGDEAIVSVEASGSSTTEFAEPGDTWTLAGGCLRADSRDGEDWYVNDVLCLADDGAFPLGGMGSGSGDLAGPTRFRAVQHDGRWFASPVATVLDHLDVWIGNFDQRDLYELLGLEHLLPPEATLGLGEQLSVAQAGGRTHVFEFEGRAGQEVIGLIETGDEDSGGYGQLYGPDGGDIEDGYGVLQGGAATLPVDGTYTLLVRFYGASDFTLTLWDAAQAPPEAFESPYAEVIDEECVTEVDGSMACASSDFDSVAPATTVAAADVVP